MGDTAEPLGLNKEWLRGAWEEFGTRIPALKHDPLAALNAIDYLIEQRNELQREADRMRPVVEAVCDQFDPRGMTTNCAVSKRNRTMEAIAAYREATNE